MLLYLNRKRAFRYTPGILERNNGLESEQEENPPCSPASPVHTYSLKTSSSEWNSSDDLAGPLSEQEESSQTNSLLHSYHPPLPPKPSLSGIRARDQPKNRLPVLRRWIETPVDNGLSSDASSKSGSSDQERNDLSASESEDRLPSPKPRLDKDTDSPSSSLTDLVLPTTFFSVDSCMTDTYRAKYHKKPGLYRRGEDHTSSGESDAEGRGHSLTKSQPIDTTRSRTESGMESGGPQLQSPSAVFLQPLYASKCSNTTESNTWLMSSLLTSGVRVRMHPEVGGLEFLF